MCDSKFKRALQQVMDEEIAEFHRLAEECDHVFSEKFEKKMQKLIKRTRKPYYSLINTGFKRAACIIVVIMTCFGGLMNVEAVRDSFKNFRLFTNDDDMTKININGNAGFPTSIEEIYVITYNLLDYEIIYKWRISRNGYRKKCFFGTS